MAPLMRILTVHGEVEVEVPDEGDRSIVGSHWNAVQAVGRGDLSSIGQFEVERPAGQTLMTKPKAITRWLKQHDVDGDDIYGTG